MLIGGYYVIHWVNKEKAKKLEERVKMDVLIGYEIFPPFKNPKQFNVIVKPKTSKTVIYGVTGLNLYSFKSKTSSKISKPLKK